jgi:Ca-activated chloride channel family protein
MEFIFPSALWLLLAVPVVIGAYVLAQRRRQRYTVRFSSLTLLREAVGRGPGIRRHIPPALFMLGLAALLVAFSRPFTTAALPTNGATVILTIDASGSMRANDLKPSRFEAAKSAARAFVEKQASTTRIGVVSFSNNASLVQAPTTDKAAVLTAIDRLTTQRSTAIGSGILVSLDAIAEVLGQDLPSAAPTPLAQSGRAVPGSSLRPSPTPVAPGQFAPAVIVLLSDGQNTAGPLPLDAAQVAVSRGVRIYTVGVGTPQGSSIGGGGGGGFFRAELDELTLRKVAKMTGARYFYAATETDLHDIYQSLDSMLVIKTEPVELTFLATAAGAGLLLLGGALSLLWFNRLP